MRSALNGLLLQHCIMKTFKWAVIAALYHEDIKQHLKRISLRQQCHRNGNNTTGNDLSFH